MEFRQTTMTEADDAAITIEPDRYYLGLWYLEVEETECNFLLTASRPLDAVEPTEWVIEYRWRYLKSTDPIVATRGVHTQKTEAEVERDIDKMLREITTLEFKFNTPDKDKPRGKKKTESLTNLRIFDFFPAHCSGKELTDRMIISPAMWMAPRSDK